MAPPLATPLTLIIVRRPYAQTKKLTPSLRGLRPINDLHNFSCIKIYPLLSNFNVSQLLQINTSSITCLVISRVLLVISSIISSIGSNEHCDGRHLITYTCTPPLCFFPGSNKIYRN